MKIQPTTTVLEKMDARIFFALAFIFQLLFIFQGIDLSDSGFYATFYQQIYHAPETTQYNFMFWFSGIVGGAVAYVFPDLGLWSFRLAGVLVTTGTLIVTYNLLKNYLHRGFLKLGLFLVLLYINNNLKEVHYNDLSSLLNMLVIAYLFNGLKQNNLWKIAVSGLFVALSTFTRLPNILCLGLGLGIFYYGYHQKTKFGTQVTQALIFGAGFVGMTGFILLFMKLIGHLDIFFNSIKLLYSMGKGGEESFYGPMALLKNFTGAYFASIKYIVFVAVGAVGLATLSTFASRFTFYRKWMADIVKYAIIVGLCILAVKGILSRDIVMYFFSGLCLASTVLIFFSNAGREIKLLALMGCYILLTYPFSSSAGLFTVGIYSIWLSFPIALDYFYRIRSVDHQMRFPGVAIIRRVSSNVSDMQWKQIINATVIVSIFACLVYTWRYPFFDRHDRLEMTSSIDNKYLKGIFTTKERAAALNDLLHETQKYAKPDDYLIAYQCIPMINYLTRTKPYMRSSYPWLYEAETFKAQLDEGLQETKTLPVVIVQKIKTIGASSNWPDSTSEDLSVYQNKNAKRDAYMNEFLQAHQYEEVWDSRYFKLFVPPAVAKREE